MNKTWRILLAAAGLGLTLVTSSHAATTATLEVTKPLADGTVKLTFTANGVTQTVTPPEIKATDSAEAKAKKINDALKAKGYNPATKDTTITIPSLPNGTKVDFDPGKTGEGKDQLKVTPATASVSSAAIGFASVYDSVGGDGDPAVFTAGVVVGLAEITVEYRADDSSGEISGATVASELFATLSDAVAAAGLDVSLSLEDDGLISVEFGEGTRGARGITFGTTSTRSGVTATVR